MNEGDDRTLIIPLSEISRGLRVESSASTLVDELKRGATIVEGRGEEDTRQVLLVAAAATEGSGNAPQCVDRRPEEEGARECSEEDTEEKGSSGVRECAYVCASTRRGMHTT
jgi:hypothetical protein